MKGILLWILNYINNHLTGAANLHWSECKRSLSTERLMKYAPALPPMFAIPSKCEITIMAVPRSTSAKERV